jgi:2-oxoglutarate dehydrogenase E2 component (dihydrolipoamide succinyltransferase)
MTEIRVPTLGESVTEATIGKWFKQAGEAVAVDEPLVELETDKVTIEVPAPTAGLLSDIAVKNGDTVAVGALTVPKWSNTGTVLRLKGKGVARADGSKGDELVRLDRRDRSPCPRRRRTGSPGNPAGPPAFRRQCAMPPAQSWRLTPKGSPPADRLTGCDDAARADPPASR